MTTTTNATATKALNEIADSLYRSPNSCAHVAVCEFSSEDSTPTLHIDLWRGDDLHNIIWSGDLNHLEVVAEGHWDGGRSYSLQFIP